MSWIYPQAIVQQQDWYDSPANYGILPALMLGDSEFAWTPAGVTVNFLTLDMGQNCAECHIRAKRGTAQFNNAQLVVIFYDDWLLPQNTETWIVNLINTPDWDDFYYTPSFPWRYVYLEGQSIQVEVGVSVLRGEAISAAMPRRLLTGVGL